MLKSTIQRKLRIGIDIPSLLLSIVPVRIPWKINGASTSVREKRNTPFFMAALTKLDCLPNLSTHAHKHV